jgi:hypothetical protein
MKSDEAMSPEELERWVRESAESLARARDRLAVLEPRDRFGRWIAVKHKRPHRFRFRLESETRWQPMIAPDLPSAERALRGMFGDLLAEVRPWRASSARSVARSEGRKTRAAHSDSKTSARTRDKRRRASAEERPFRIFEYRLRGLGPWFIALSTLPGDTADALREQIAARHGCAVEVRARV